MLLCHLGELTDGGSRGFDPRGRGRDALFVIRRGTALHAYENACPHHGTAMAWRKDAYLDAAGERIACSAHGAQFEIETGRCLLGPCLGQSLTPVPLTLGEDGKLHLASAICSLETTP